MIFISYEIGVHSRDDNVPGMSVPPANITMKTEPRPPLYIGFRTPPASGRLFSASGATRSANVVKDGWDCAAL
jgi:hypothetical protein